MDIKAPTFPESITEGTVAVWHKAPGEPVRRDDLLVDIETDKVVLEVVAPADGQVTEVMKQEGDMVASEELLATFEPGEVSAPRHAGRRCRAGECGTGECEPRGAQNGRRKGARHHAHSGHGPGRAYYQGRRRAICGRGAAHATAAGRNTEGGGIEIRPATGPGAERGGIRCRRCGGAGGAARAHDRDCAPASPGAWSTPSGMRPC